MRPNGGRNGQPTRLPKTGLIDLRSVLRAGAGRLAAAGRPLLTTLEFGMPRRSPYLVERRRLTIIAARSMPYRVDTPAERGPGTICQPGLLTSTGDEMVAGDETRVSSAARSYLFPPFSMLPVRRPQHAVEG